MDSTKQVLDFGMKPARPHEPFLLHRLFEGQAARAPHAPAVTYEDETVSYGELDQLANGLAHLLRDAFGIKPGDHVGLVVDRSAYMLATILAILKAGATYVPINPRHPWSFMATIADSARLGLLIVEAKYVSQVSAFDGDMFIMDIELPGLAPATTPPDVAEELDRLAYIIYTSGSTGVPKGVPITHRAISNTIAWRIKYYGIDATNINMQVPSIAFDSSVLDIFSPLSAGGHLIVPREERRFDTGHLVELMARHEVHSFITVPSYYQHLLNGLPRDRSLPLRWITLAGEATWPALVRRHYEQMPDVRLYNEYGPTENSVCSTACVLASGEDTVPIGTPVDNVRIFVLDDSNTLVPPGVPGEILLGGPGLATGYHANDDASRDAFVASPIPRIYADVLYRTGDLAYWRPDGQLVFTGRTDSQVKIRGFRIELQHVECAFQDLPVVNQAAVVCKGDNLDMYLSAYVSLIEPASPADLKSALRDKLPYYMIPDKVTILDELPINLNGKLDRQYLAGLADDEEDGSVSAAPALDPLTKTVLDIWRDVLAQDRLGLDDQFFDRGGNSLKALQVIQSVRERLMIDVSVRLIYLYPTVSELVAQVRKAQQEAGSGERHDA